MSNASVISDWLYSQRESAHQGNILFDGDAIYSYGYHFQMAQRFGTVTLLTSANSSPTTNRHVSLLRRVLHHSGVKVINVYHVNPITPEHHAVNIEDMETCITELSHRALRRRIKGYADLDYAQADAIRRDLVAYKGFFKL